MNIQELKDELKKVNIPSNFSWEDVPNIKTIPVISNILCLALYWFFRMSRRLQYNVFMALCEIKPTYNQKILHNRSTSLWKKRSKLLKHKNRNASQLKTLFHSAFWGGQEFPKTTSTSSASSCSCTTNGGLLPQNTSSTSSSRVFSKSVQTTQDCVLRRAKSLILKKNKCITKLRGELKELKKMNKQLQVSQKKIFTRRVDLWLKLTEAQRRLHKAKLIALRPSNTKLNKDCTPHTADFKPLFDFKPSKMMLDPECGVRAEDEGSRSPRLEDHGSLLKMVKVEYDRPPQQTDVE